MSVELDPVELGFARPFTREVSQTLHLKNPHAEPIAFKVKTTAPKQYCVRPNSGRIESGNVVEVQVLLQAMKEDPPLEAKCRDKFLVQSVAITSDKEFEHLAQAWTHIEQTNKSSIHEKKIRVNFLPAGGSGLTASGVGAATTPARQSMGANGAHDEVPPAYSSPMSNAATPAPHSSATAPVGSVSRLDARPADATSTKEAVATANNPANVVATAGSAVAGGVKAVAAAVPASSDELKAQLEEAKARIAQLVQQAQEQTGLRQRKPDSTATETRSASSTTSALSTQQAPSGVPVPIVAALCLISFLLAYLLF